MDLINLPGNKPFDLMPTKLYSMVCSSSSCLLLILGTGVYKYFYQFLSRYSSAEDSVAELEFVACVFLHLARLKMLKQKRRGLCTFQVLFMLILSSGIGNECMCPGGTSQHYNSFKFLFFLFSQISLFVCVHQGTIFHITYRIHMLLNSTHVRIYRHILHDNITFSFAMNIVSC